MKTLQSSTEIKVRFNEADPMGIVWHGHYIQYLEDGREAFGKKYGMSYLYVHENGYSLPVVSISCDYKKSLRYGDSVTIETTYHDHPAAKVEFTYKLFRASDKQLVATGKSTQVFLDSKNELQLMIPEFVLIWKKKVGLL